MDIWTIGHSTHPRERFIALLERHAIAAVADVRIAPASRRHPQFAAAALARSLSERGVGLASDGGTSEHELTEFAIVSDDGDITYPSRQGSLRLDRP